MHPHFLVLRDHIRFIFYSWGIRSASRWAAAWAISSVLASTITRIRASVPDGRTSTRPSPFRALSSCWTAWASNGLAIADFFTSLSVTGTLISTCGKRGQHPNSSEALFPLSFSRANICNAVNWPSPVVAYSRKIMWPDCSA